VGLIHSLPLRVVHVGPIRHDSDLRVIIEPVLAIEHDRRRQESCVRKCHRIDRLIKVRLNFHIIRWHAVLILIAQSVQNVKGHLEYNLKLKTEHHAHHCLIGAANKLIYEASKAEEADEY
jgi:hypothetical protein